MLKCLNLLARHAFVPGLAGVLLILDPSAAAAQEAGADEGFEEITVTARRREETLQEVPIAVTAYTAEALAEAGAVDITALSQTTPNTTLEVSRATTTTLTAYIRGVGQQDPLAGFEGGVGIYLDDVYLARPQGTVFDIYDVERIEVLRGPQGTLYGRNTIGGAVKYVTRKLSAEPEFEVTASLGSYSQADLMLKGSVPLSDTFRIGATAASFNRDGFGDNLTTGEENANKDILGIRATAEWEPNGDWFIRLYGDYTLDRANPRHGHRLLPGPAGEPVLGDVFDTRAGISLDSTYDAGLENEVDQSGVGLLVQWDFADQWQFKSITASREDNTESLIDFDNLQEDTFDAPVIYENEQFSQEFQFTYTGDKLAGVFGLYYLDANAFDAFDVVFLSSVTAFTLGDYDTEAWAAFADFTYDFNEQWSLSVGGRYTEDERTARVQRETFLGLGSPFFGIDNLSGTSPVIVDGEEVVPTFNGTRTDSDFTPRVSLSFAPNGSHNLYVSYSEGFKGGGFDPRGAYQVAAVRAGFEPETVESFEIGAKSVLAGGDVLTNIALFTSDYTNVQVPGSILLDADGDGEVDGFAGATTNAGKADIWGAEFEMIANFTDAFSSTLALGYIDADYTEWLVAETDPVSGETTFVDISGDRVFQNTPEWSAALGLRYEWPLSLFGNSGALAFLGSVSYRDDTFQFEIPNPLVDQEAYEIYNASLVWNSDDGRYRLGLHGRNLGDEEYVVANYDFPAVANSVIGFFGDPRTFTGSFTVRF